MLWLAWRALAKANGVKGVQGLAESDDMHRNRDLYREVLECGMRNAECGVKDKPETRNLKPETSSPPEPHV